jgi:integrase-like protein
MAAVGLDPRYATHTCRHTYATHLYRASGADLEIVQEQLGHASIKTTTIYAKVTREDKLRAADALAKAFRNSQPCVPAIGHLRMPRRANSHRLPPSVASSVAMGAGGAGGQTANSEE